MPWQEFREQKLWSLEIDDLYKANLAAIGKLYKEFATSGTTKAKLLTKEDATRLMFAAEQRRPDLFTMPSAERHVITAYSLSKMTIGDEMAEFHKYNEMPLVEFYEFIGRWAEITFSDDIPLVKKIEQLFDILLGIIKTKVKQPGLDDDCSSDSDYDENIAEELVQELFKSPAEVNK